MGSPLKDDDVKIYTKTGDKGRTSLFSGERTGKSDTQVEAYGDVDELNAVLGALIGSMPEHRSYREPLSQLRNVQSHLFQIGTFLATTCGSSVAKGLKLLDEGIIENIEAYIDKMNGEMAPLSGFLLPGGSEAASWAHIARTVCRRAERHIVGMLEDKRTEEPWVPTTVIAYINRLSDYLFVLARYCNHLSGVSDVPWVGDDFPQAPKPQAK